MPTYSGNLARPVLTPGFPIKVWNGEVIAITSPTGGEDSQAVSLHRHQGLPSCISVEIAFSGDPGTFQVDLQTADTDLDHYYVTKASLSAVNGSFVGRLEVTNVVAKFARLKTTNITHGSVTAVATLS